MRLSRMKRELELLTTQPPHGIQSWPKDDSLDTLEAKIQGPQDTPYENGIFKLEINIPKRYPIEPPSIRFVTPIYHPNIDNGGRICLDILNMPPKGAWKPSLNISTVLTSIQLLMSEPNPDDGLMSEITEQFRNNRTLFTKIAKEYTQKYAMEHVNTSNVQKKQEEEDDSSSSEDSEDEKVTTNKRKRAQEKEKNAKKLKTM